MKNLIEEKVNIYNEERDNTRQEYETVLIKYEADIREHIKIEHQMKLYIDSLETEKEELKYKNKLKKIKIDQLSQKLSNIKFNTEDDHSTIIVHEDTSSSRDSKTENESISQVGKFRKFEEEIIELKKELDKFKEQNKNLSNNIKKINEQYNKELNEAKDSKNKYKKEIKLLKKQLLISESKLKHITEINTNNINNNNSKNSQPKKNIFKTQSNNSIHVSNDISMHRIPSNNKKIDLSILLNKTTEDVKMFEMLNSKKFQLKTTWDTLNDNLNKSQDKLYNSLEKDSIPKLNKNTQQILEPLKDPKFITLDNSKDPAETAITIQSNIDELENADKNFKKIEQNADTYNDFLRVLGQPEHNFSKVYEVREIIDILKNLWTALQSFGEDCEKWKKTEFSALDTKDILDKCSNYETIGRRAAANLGDNGSAIQELITHVESFAESMRVVDYLKCPDF